MIKYHLLYRLINLSALLKDSPDELLYGKVGYLYALLFVNKHVSEKTLISSSHIEQVILKPIIYIITSWPVKGCFAKGYEK